MMNSVRYARGLVLLALLAGVVAAAGGAAAEPDAPDATATNAGWEEIGAGSASGGGISNGTSGAFDFDPSLAIGPDGAPVVAWESRNSSREFVYIRRWNGSAWVEIGSGSATSGGINDNVTWVGNPSLAIDIDNSPIVAWDDLANWNDEIFVRRWNGLAWAEMRDGSATGGGISNNDSYSIAPSLAIGPDGSPIVAWLDAGSDNAEIYVRRWNGSAWVELGSGSATIGGISNNNGESVYPSLAISPDGSPVIAWSDSSSGNSEIYVRRWNGADWVELRESASGGGISNNIGYSLSASVAIGLDGSPIVAWQDDSSYKREIYLRRWNGSAWVQMGSGSATGGGINNTGGASNPSLAVGSDGTPVVAWTDDISGQSQIYIRRWNGLAWVEMGIGSATGGGISDSKDEAKTPSLAIGPDGAPVVAWADNSSGNTEIYVRRYPSATCYTLELNHTGQGSNPTPSPPNSTGCAAGSYTAGQAITLTASPAAGHRVKNWSGTANNSSTAMTNSLTMPAANHTASVTYEAIPGTTHRAFAPAIANVPQTCWPGPHETGSNNDKENADGPLCSGYTYTGDPDDSFDVFFFESKRAGSIAIRLDNHAGGGVQLSLLDSAFKLIDRDFEPADGYRLDLTNQPPGRYYVVVHAAVPKPGSSIQYTLRATFPANP